ncbi:MAG: ATP-binding protein [Syntrophobacteraceae bacterium]|nr:ATP-binding protein [Syntrophobacteraceae bacterium]
MHTTEPHWKVLLIDADRESTDQMTQILGSHACTVLTAETGAQGLRLCRDWLPQIVITAVRLPDMDGMDVLERIKSECPHSEVVVATVHAQVDNILKAFRLNAADFIGKPIQDAALTAAVERARQRYLDLKKLQRYTELIEEKWLDTSEALEKTFKFQKKLIESSIDGIVGCDYDRRIIIFNKSMEQMLEYSKGMVIGRMFLYQLFSSEGWETFQDQLCSDDLGGEDKLFLSECTLISRRGKKIPVRLSAQVLFQKNEDIGVVVFFRDLTTIKRLKQQFIDQVKYLHQDKMVSLGKLAASVVHEINNPLAGVLNYIRLMSKLLGRNVPSPEEIQKFRKYLDIMGSEVQRSSEIVSNLLAFSRKSKLEFSEVDVNGVLEKSIMLSSHKLMMSNIQIQKHLSPAAPKVLGDFNQLQQCVLNLVFNAADAMPDGGSITVESIRNPGSRMVEIKVADTGRGISRENLPKIFDPFFSTKQEGKGLGLGLSVVYGIIDRHKGAITAESEPGQGTVFSIQLPVLEQRDRG